jgi:prepilin-type N-terminal cleavage/methylation domain-containing protein
MKTAYYINKGFTLIELLVVIGILGILATALVATIDPFEQLKKASDSNIKNAAVEFSNANLRYYTTHNAMPWHVTNGITGCGTAGAISDTLDSTAGENCVQGLIDDGELKAQFIDATGITSKIYVTGDTGTSVTACFLPESRAQQRDPATIYDEAGAEMANGICGTNGSAPETCYWCASL